MKKMSFLAAIAVLFSLVLFRAEAGAFGGCEEDCSKCHSLQKSEAQQILEKLHVSDAKVLDIKMSPIRGLWQIEVDNKGNRGVLYVGFSKKYVIGGSIFEVDTAQNKTQETLKETQQPDRFVDVSKIPLENAIVLGDKNAALKVIVFDDPD
jgi:thiol:disulfide interchange protein DsbC